LLFPLFSRKSLVDFLPGKRNSFLEKSSYPFSGKKIPLDFFQKRAIFFRKKGNPFSTIGKKENKVCCSLTPIVKQVEPG